MNFASLRSSVTANGFALPILLTGAAGISFAPVFVRLSETGPVSTAFYRLLFALPMLWLWTMWDHRKERPAPDSKPMPRPRKNENGWKWLLLAGLFFAGDLALWHWAIVFTSVANATLLTNFAPVFVTFGAWFLFKEKISRGFLVGLAVAMGGATALVGTSFGFGLRQVWGDALALTTALFYAGYILSIKRARVFFNTSVTMFRSGLVTCAALFGVAALTENQLLATSLRGWSVLLGLALISHVCGQTFIAHALAHLPAGFASVGLLLQPVGATLLAWWILNESPHWMQGIGGILVLTGILIAWRASPLKRPV